MLKSAVSVRTVLAVAVLATASVVGAQTRDSVATFPNRVVRLVVPAGAGSPPDVRARLIGRKLAEQWGQPVVVDNRPGAGGQLAMEQIAQSAPDGHTLALSGHAVLTIAPHLRKLPFDPLKDFSPITLTGTTPIILVVHPALPVRNVAELIAYAKRNPGKLNAASPGIGTTGHLALELFNRATGVAMTHVPYRDGVGQTIVDLTTGKTDLTFDVFPGIGSYLQSGRLRALAVAGSNRMALLPDVPTFKEAGLPEMESVFIWAGFLVRAGTPRAIVDKLNQAITGTLELPDVRASFIDTGSQPNGSTPEQFATHLRAEQARWGKLIREAGIKLD